MTDVVVLALLGALVTAGSVAGACLVLRGVDRGLALLDDERGALVCRVPPDRLPPSGPSAVAVPGAAHGTTVPCLPARLDDDAPGRPRRAAPEAFCTLLRQAGLPAAAVEGRPCL